MAAYLVAMLDVTDPRVYEQYKVASPPTIAAAGGRYIARGGDVLTLEGSHDGRRVVIIEFPDVQAAKDWYNGSTYGAARELRRTCARNVTFLVVPGVA